MKSLNIINATVFLLLSVVLLNGQNRNNLTKSYQSSQFNLVSAEMMSVLGSMIENNGVLYVNEETSEILNNLNDDLLPLNVDLNLEFENIALNENETMNLLTKNLKKTNTPGFLSTQKNESFEFMDLLKANKKRMLYNDELPMKFNNLKDIKEIKARSTMIKPSSGRRIELYEGKWHSEVNMKNNMNKASIGTWKFNVGPTEIKRL